MRGEIDCSSLPGVAAGVEIQILLGMYGETKEYLYVPSLKEVG